MLCARKTASWEAMKCSATTHASGCAPPNGEHRRLPQIILRSLMFPESIGIMRGHEAATCPTQLPSCLLGYRRTVLTSVIGIHPSLNLCSPPHGSFDSHTSSYTHTTPVHEGAARKFPAEYSCVCGTVCVPAIESLTPPRRFKSTRPGLRLPGLKLNVTSTLSFGHHSPPAIPTFPIYLFAPNAELRWTSE